MSRLRPFGRAAAARLLVWSIAIAPALLLPACYDEHAAAMAAADLAAADGDSAREEALLTNVARRLGRQRARLASRANAAARRGKLAEERALHERLAELYAGPLGAPRDAIVAWQKLLALEPPAEQAGRASLALAELHAYRLGEREAAIAHYLRASSLLGSRPLAATASLAAAEHALALGQAERTAKLCEEILQSWPDTDHAARASLLLGHARSALGDAAAALLAFAAPIEQRPRTALAAEAMVQLAALYKARGEAGQALEWYARALASHPNATMVRDAMVRLESERMQATPHRFILQGTPNLTRVARR